MELDWTEDFAANERREWARAKREKLTIETTVPREDKPAFDVAAVEPIDSNPLAFKDISNRQRMLGKGLIDPSLPSDYIFLEMLKSTVRLP